MKCLWSVAVSCFVSLSGLSAESLPGDLLASFPPFTAESLVPQDPATQEIVDDTLELSTDSVAYSTYERRLTDTSITVDVSFANDEADALFLGVRIQSRTPLSGYIVDITRDGNVRLVTLVGGEDTILASKGAGFLPGNDPITICYQVARQSLKAWIWPKGSAQPDQPTIRTILPQPLAFTEGRPVIGVRGGTARYERLEIAGVDYRPVTAGFQPLSPQARLKISWPSVADRVYRIDSSADRIVWDGLYLFKATSETSEAVIVSSFAVKPASFIFLRVVDVASNTEVQGNPAPPLVPATPRYAIAWRSAENRVYGFEWSQDLETWNRYPGLAVPGADGTTLTDTVLPLPEELKKQDADRLYLRVLDLDDDDGFGIVPVEAP